MARIKHIISPKKEQCKLLLTGKFKTNVNYSFQCYKHAVEMEITGLVKISNKTNIEIIAEAERPVLHQYLAWLNHLIEGHDLKMVDEWSSSTANYKEFRIFGECKPQKNSNQ